MFEGELGRKMMVEQGYIPHTCTLPVEFAGPLVWSEINKGRSPCWECHDDRTVCKGQPKKDD